MSGWKPTGATKRQKELARQEYQREKAAKREERKKQKADREARGESGPEVETATPTVETPAVTGTSEGGQAK